MYFLSNLTLLGTIIYTLDLSLTSDISCTICSLLIYEERYTLVLSGMHVSNIMAVNWSHLFISCSMRVQWRVALSW